MSLITCCLYVQLGLAGMIHHPGAPEGRYWPYDINNIVNPYGVVEVGYERGFKDLEVTLALRHDSSIPAPDFGQNTVEIGLRWYPWRDR